MKRFFLLISILISSYVCLHQASQANAQEQRYTVGTSGQTKPLNYFDEKGELTGIEIDILQEIDRRSPNIAFDYQITEFASLFAGLDSGQFDLVANNLGENPERREKFLFSLYPYIITHNVLITSKEKDENLTIADLAGHSFGVVPASPQSIYLESWNQSHPLQAVEIQYADSDPASLIRDVYNGRIDATIYATTYLKDVQDTYGIELRAHPIANEEDIRIPGSYFIFRPEEESLRQEVDQILADLRQEGFLKKISMKYLDQDDTQLTPQIMERNQTFEQTRLAEKRDKELISIPAILKAFPLLIKQLPVTLLITLVAGLLSLVLGFGLAWVKIKQIRGLNEIVTFFVSYMRGTPLLVQLFLAYYGLPILIQWLNSLFNSQMTINQIPAILYSFIALGLHESAYNSETFRSAIQAVDRHEIEAAQSIGLNQKQILKRIILPNALLIALPNLGNSLIRLLKGTSLAFTITVVEMMGQAKIIAGANLRYFEAYIAISLIYWILCILLEGVFKRLESSLDITKKSHPLPQDKEVIACSK